MATPKAGLKTMPTNILKNEQVFNEGVTLLEALCYRGVVSRSLLDPSTISSPAPSNGTIYLVPDGSPNATGDWASHGGDIAVYYDGWRYIPPAEGLTLWVTDEAQSIQYRSGAWVDRNELPPTNLTDLADVSLAGSPSPADGEALTYNASLGLWMAGAGGSGSGLAPALLGTIDLSVNNATTSEAAALQITGMKDYKNVILEVKGLDPAEGDFLRARFLTDGGTVGVANIYDGIDINDTGGSGVVGQYFGVAAAAYMTLNRGAVDNGHGVITGHWNSITPTLLNYDAYDNNGVATSVVSRVRNITSTTTIYDGLSFFTSANTVIQGVIKAYGWN